MKIDATPPGPPFFSARVTFGARRRHLNNFKSRCVSLKRRQPNFRCSLAWYSSRAVNQLQRYPNRCAPICVARTLQPPQIDRGCAGSRATRPNSFVMSGGEVVARWPRDLWPPAVARFAVAPPRLSSHPFAIRHAKKAARVYDQSNIRTRRRHRVSQATHLKSVAHGVGKWRRPSLLT